MPRPAARPAVLQVLSTEDGEAVARGVVQLARALVEAGWAAVVASPGGRLERELAGCGGVHVTLPLDSRNPLTVFADVRRLARTVTERNVKLIHAHGPLAGWTGAFAAKRAKIGFMTTFHRVQEGQNHWLKRRFNGVMTAGDRVIAVSDFIAEHIQEGYEVDGSRVRIVRHGVDLSAFDPAAVRGHRIAALSERWQLGYERRVVILPGRVERAKGHLVALEAMARMKRKDFLLLVVGDLDSKSAYVREIERTILAKNLSDRVHFGGHCDDMAAAYMLADVVILPAVEPEAFGRVAIEAQAMGKPVVVSHMGALPETVMPASTGWLIKPDDPDELAWALDLALSMEGDVKERLAERARAFVVEELSIEQMCRRTIDIYRELVRNAPRPATVAA
ncbi:MAG: glycosyltransferase family 4 protein [Geminicoccaceae bacterium]|nr:glycosyltransferase family 4 protein [Geminicoccaceae bacterium]